jgi:glycosyltransferase involved in cell wall biosynthesis
VAIVVQRYGAEVSGGAELLARQIAELLAARHRVEVLTTCALDYVTWRDVYPAGTSALGPVTVHRFSVPTPRQLDQFAPLDMAVTAGDHSPAIERGFLAEQGPYAPGLLRHLREHGDDYDAVIFFTALYTTTLLGLPLVAGRSILVPTVHDEPPMRLAIFARVIPRARWLLFNTPEERELAHRLYRLDGVRETVAGVGVEAPTDLDPAAVRARFSLTRPYLLYAGRIDRLKGCPELFRDFSAWARLDDRVDLVLIGRAAMEVPRHPRIRHLGFVDDRDRWSLLAAALATVVPSRMESLSLVSLESLAVGTPVLATAASPVLAGLIRRSRGGLLFDDGATLAESAALLLDRPAVRRSLGTSGEEHVRRACRWEAIAEIYQAAISDVASIGGQHVP